jgi:hypothetical protein
MGTFDLILGKVVARRRHGEWIVDRRVLAAQSIVLSKSAKNCTTKSMYRETGTRKYFMQSRKLIANAREQGRWKAARGTAGVDKAAAALAYLGHAHQPPHVCLGPKVRAPHASQPRSSSGQSYASSSCGVVLDCNQAPLALGRS